MTKSTVKNEHQTYICVMVMLKRCVKKIDTILGSLVNTFRRTYMVT